MTTQTIVCPPLTQDDIFILRGTPMAKKITPLHGFPSLYKEEWIYYKNTKEESFTFKNRKLIGYKTNVAI
jgi:hypothetical protein